MTPSGQEICGYRHAPESYIDTLFGVIIPICYSFAPFTIIILVNGAIIYKFAVAKWRNSYGHSNSTDQALSKSAVKGTTCVFYIHNFNWTSCHNVCSLWEQYTFHS